MPTLKSSCTPIITEVASAHCLRSFDNPINGRAGRDDHGPIIYLFIYFYIICNLEIFNFFFQNFYIICNLYLKLIVIKLCVFLLFYKV